MKNEIVNASNILKTGGVILYPTDTVWGIGCDSHNDEAVKKVFKIKNRKMTNPLICLASSFEMVSRYVRVFNLEILKKISKKSPTTFIFNNPKIISKYILGNKDSIAFRVPNNEFCIALINKLDRPIVSTSANISGKDIPPEYKMISNKIKDNVDYRVNLARNNRSNIASEILIINEEGLITKIR
mgnify:FL=1